MPNASRLISVLRRFAADVRGNVAMIFALVLPVLLIATLGGVDIHRASTVRMNLQDALDAATLAAARTNFTSEADLTRVGLAALQANLAPYDEITLVTTQTRFRLTSDSKVIGDAKVNVAAVVANVVLPPYGQLFDDQLPVNAHTEVNRSSQNVEVALVLDTTGSMGQGTKIADLRLAAKDLVDIVVQDSQSPWYSKVSVVPYSMGVNVGAAATTARGSITGSTNINSITWYNGVPKAVTAATKANPVVITAAAHGFQNGDKVVIWGQTGMSQLNGRVFTVANRATNTFRLSGVDGRNFNTFSNNNLTFVAKCERTDCYATVNANGHGIPDGGYVYLTGIGGMTQLNAGTFRTDFINNNRYVIETVGYGVYTTGGLSWCAQQGCQWYAFTNVEGNLTTHQVSTCVTERSGTNAYTDASPATTLMGRNYPSTSNPCLSNVIRPLSSDRTTIKAQIDTLVAAGSTGGHIGVGWGWYSISPNFNAMWPSTPAGAYGRETLKAVVIMTDGEYNTAYCNGVIAQNSTSGSGATSGHINCDAPNGHPFDQTQALCREMKAKGVVVYTVGFQVVDDQRARDLVNGCATDPNHVYLPTNGASLRQAFQAIGRDITALRISR